MKKLAHLILLTLILSACGGAPIIDAEILATPTADTGITIWVQETDDVTQLQIMLDTYSQMTGEMVTLVAPLDAPQLASALTGQSVPDVLVLDGAEMLSYYVHAGYLGEIIGVDSDSLFPAPLGQCQIDGKLYCLPWTTNLYALYWNKDMFTAAGLDPEAPPETLEQLTDYADKLTRFGLEGQLEQVGFLPDQPARHLWVYTQLMGGSWYSEDVTQLAVNSQPVLDAFLWEGQFYTKYDSELVDAYMTDAGESPFANGKVAMQIAPAGATFPGGLNFGVAPIPFPGDATEQAGTFLFGGKVIVIPQTADSHNVAKFLEWMISPEISAQVACAERTLPANRNAIQDACFSGQPGSDVFVSMLEMPVGYVNLSTPASSELESALGQVEQQVLFFGADPRPLLEQIQVQLESQFRELMNAQ